MANLESRCEKKRRLFLWYLWVAIWNSERSLLPSGFGSAVWWFALSWCVCNIWIWFVTFSLVCTQFVFSIRIWNLWIFSSLVLYLWIMRESYLGVFEIWNCKSTSTPICIIQIWYSEICSSSPMDVGYCRTT